MPQNFDPGAAARPTSGLFGLDVGPEEARVHILPVPFDATTSFRKGTAGGPAAVLAASHQVDLHDPLTGEPWEAGLWMAPIDRRVIEWNDRAGEHAERVIAVGGAIGGEPSLQGDLAEVNRIGAALNDWVEREVGRAMDAGKLVGLLGGDHATPFGAILAASRRHPGLGVLHVDAHADLRVAFEGFTWSHASILHNVATRIPEVAKILQVGIRDFSAEEEAFVLASGGRIQWLLDGQWAAAKLDRADLRALVRATLRELPHEVYVTFDIDGLDPALCPNTGTPVPGGLTWHEAMLWLQELVDSGRRIVGFDLNEVAPDRSRDCGSGWDEIVGARLLYRLIGFALRSSRLQ